MVTALYLISWSHKGVLVYFRVYLNSLERCPKRCWRGKGRRGDAQTGNQENQKEHAYTPEEVPGAEVLGAHALPVMTFDLGYKD